jgi:hypothetical protein
VLLLATQGNCARWEPTSCASGVFYTVIYEKFYLLRAACSSWFLDINLSCTNTPGVYEVRRFGNDIAKL